MQLRSLRYLSDSVVDVGNNPQLADQLLLK